MIAQNKHVKCEVSVGCKTSIGFLLPFLKQMDAFNLENINICCVTTVKQVLQRVKEAI
jgi:hypothetical protein